MKPKNFDIKLLLQSDEPKNMSPRTLHKWRVDQQGPSFAHAREARRATEEGSIPSESSPEHEEDKKVLVEDHSEKNQVPDTDAPEDEATQEEPKGSEDYISVTPENCPTVEIRLNGPEPVPEDGTATKKRKKKREDTVLVSLSSRVFKRRDEKEDDPENSKRRKEDEKLTKLMDQLESDTQRPRCKHGLHCKSTDALHFLKFVHTPENPDLSRIGIYASHLCTEVVKLTPPTEMSHEELLWDKLNYCQKENERLTNQIIRLELSVEVTLWCVRSNSALTVAIGSGIAKRQLCIKVSGAVV